MPKEECRFAKNGAWRKNCDHFSSTVFKTLRNTEFPVEQNVKRTIGVTLAADGATRADLYDARGTYKLST
jgi:hypothetical protein